MPFSLPVSLTKNLSDAELEVVSWSAATQLLVLSIRKDIGPESGVLKFSGVSYVGLVPRLTLSGISITNVAPNGVPIDESETVFEFSEAWGGSYCVVAESVAYEVLV